METELLFVEHSASRSDLKRRRERFKNILRSIFHSHVSTSLNPQLHATCDDRVELHVRRFRGGLPLAV